MRNERTISSLNVIAGFTGIWKHRVSIAASWVKHAQLDFKHVTISFFSFGAKSLLELKEYREVTVPLYIHTLCVQCVKSVALLFSRRVMRAWISVAPFFFSYNSLLSQRSQSKLQLNDFRVYFSNDELLSFFFVLPVLRMSPSVWFVLFFFISIEKEKAGVTCTF